MKRILDRKSSSNLAGLGGLVGGHGMGYGLEWGPLDGHGQGRDGRTRVGRSMTCALLVGSETSEL